MPNDVVSIHSRCIYVDESTRTTRAVELVYPEEADSAKGKISVLAPIGSALLGLAAGHSIDRELPGGKFTKSRRNVFFPSRMNGLRVKEEGGIDHGRGFNRIDIEQISPNGVAGFAPVGSSSRWGRGQRITHESSC